MLSADTSSNNKPSSGVYTCQTCNSLFTCLDYYQQHRKQHAEAEGVKLLTCAHCTYVSDNSFHFNWHIMSHASSPPHRCDVCAASCTSTVSNQSDSHGADPDGKGRISDTIVMSDGKRSVATATSDDLIYLAQLHSCSSKSTHREDVYNSLNGRHLLEGEQQNQAGDDSSTDEEEEDEETDEEDDEGDAGHDDGGGEQTDIECPENGEQSESVVSTDNCDILNNNQQQQQFYGEDEEEEEMNEENCGTEYADQEQQHQQEFSYAPDSKPEIDMGYETQIGDNMIMNGYTNGTYKLEQVGERHNEDGGCYDEEEDENGHQIGDKQNHSSPEDVYEFNSEDEDIDKSSLTKSVQETNTNFTTQAPLSAVFSTTQSIPVSQQQPGATEANSFHSIISQCQSMNPSIIFANQFASSAPSAATTANSPFLMNPIRIVPVAAAQSNAYLSSSEWSGNQLVENSATATTTAPVNNNNSTLTPTAKKSWKKATKSVPQAAATANTESNNVSPIDAALYTPSKGKGKGNRKPRINFISVVNGITVGADGIRRKFHCSHCGNGKSFKTKSHLQRHMLTHTGEKPYQCSECGSKFNQSSSLRNHIIAIHTKKFPHTCTICGKGFLMPAVLQKHIQTTGHQSATTMLPGSSGDMQLNDNQSMYANGDMSSVSINEINDRDHNFIHNQNSGTSAQPPIKIKQEMFYILSDPGAS